MEKGDSIDWVKLSYVDAIFMQRPYSGAHLNIMNMAKANGKKVWIDYDDDLFAVPFENRAFKLYSQSSVRQLVGRMIDTADHVSVSTAALANRMRWVLNQIKSSSNPDKIQVIPNAYNQAFAVGRTPTTKQNKMILWRGSNTHDKDLWVYTAALKHAYARHFKDWSINFVGHHFWYTVEQMLSIEGFSIEQLKLTNPLDPVDYWKALNNFNPSLVFVPLWNCPFNHSKSNIAWIEGIHAGAACLGPDWEEWRRPGIINYKDQKDFADKLDLVMRGEVDTLKLAQEGWEFVQDTLTLEKVNVLRKDILQKMWG